MLCSMAPVGWPLSRLLPFEVYTHKPFAERSSRQHDRPSQDRLRQDGTDRWIMQSEPRGLGPRSLYGRRFVKAAEFGLTDCACLLHVLGCACRDSAGSVCLFGGRVRERRWHGGSGGLAREINRCKPLARLQRHSQEPSGGQHARAHGFGAQVEGCVIWA
jgi:hypothetical protein